MAADCMYLSVQGTLLLTFWLAPRLICKYVHIATMIPVALVKGSNLIPVSLLHNIVDPVTREYMCCEAESHQ